MDQLFSAEYSCDDWKFDDAVYNSHTNMLYVSMKCSDRNAKGVPGDSFKDFSRSIRKDYPNKQ